MLADGVGKHTNMLSAWYDANGNFIPAEENLPPRRTLTLVERLVDLKACLKGGVGGMPLPNPRSSNYGSQKIYMIQLLDGASKVPAKCDFKKQVIELQRWLGVTPRNDRTVFLMLIKLLAEASEEINKEIDARCKRARDDQEEEDWERDHGDEYPCMSTSIQRADAK